MIDLDRILPIEFARVADGVRRGDDANQFNKVSWDGAPLTLAAQAGEADRAVRRPERQVSFLAADPGKSSGCVVGPDDPGHVLLHRSMRWDDVDHRLARIEAPASSVLMLSNVTGHQPAHRAAVDRPSGDWSGPEYR